MADEEMKISKYVNKAQQARLRKQTARDILQQQILNEVKMSSKANKRKKRRLESSTNYYVKKFETETGTGTESESKSDSEGFKMEIVMGSVAQKELLTIEFPNLIKGTKWDMKFLVVGEAKEEPANLAFHKIDKNLSNVHNRRAKTSFVTGLGERERALTGERSLQSPKHAQAHAHTPAPAPEGEGGHASNADRTTLTVNSMFGVVGSKLLSSLLLYDSSFLRVIDISGNNISGNGAEALCSCLGRNYVLSELDVSDNAIGGVGAVAFARLLGGGVGIKKLNLSGNEIGGVGGCVIGESLKNNRSLVELDLSRNQ